MTTAADAPTSRRLDRKIAAILAGAYTPDDFLIADAKDGDMAFGVGAAGPIPGAPTGTTGSAGPGRHRTRAAYLDAMRAIVAQGEIDILLASASSGEILSADGSISDDVTLAVRGNDTTDIWAYRAAGYAASPSRPFRTARLEAIRPFCDLALYSVTFNNDLERDLESVTEYAKFRVEAAALGIRHFLEVFNPNAPAATPGLAASDVGAYVNDSIMRTLAGVTRAERPLFLKMAYNGADAMAELAEHDPSIVVGILGGSAGTTRDTFELLTRAESNGARVALFGRKIQRAESQLDLVGLMRPVLRGDLTPADAVRAYHAALASAGLAPARPLEVDLQVTEPTLLSE